MKTTSNFMISSKWNFTILIASVLFVVLVFFNFSFVPGLESFASPSCNDCNVVIIDMDILRKDAIDCTNAYDRTPNICKLANQSVVFENNISQSDLTINSLVSFLTSLYPSSHQVWNESHPKQINGVEYLQDVLKNHGYDTVIAGHVIGYSQVVADGFEGILDNSYSPRNYIPENIVNYMLGRKNPFFVFYYIDDLHFPYLLYEGSFVNKYQLSNDNPISQPHFWSMQIDYVAENYKDIFTPQAIRENEKLFQNTELNKNQIFNLFAKYSYKGLNQTYVKDAWGPLKETFLKNFDANDSNEVNYMKENYLQTLHVVDNYIGVLLDFVSNSSLKDNTIFVLTSNHGDEFFEHGSFSHQNNLFQELIRTPLVVKVPGVVHKRVWGLTQDIDVMPTLLSLLGIQGPRQMQGTSLVKMMANPLESVRNYQIAQKGGDNYMVVFRKEDWKVAIKNSTPIALYDLSSDPGEKTNLIGNKLDLAKKMFSEYESIISPLPKYGLESSPLPDWVDNEKRERLKDEGYF